MNTQEIQRLIDEASGAGGGIVNISAGIHEISTIELKSNVTLHLEKNATLKGVRGLEHYKKVGFCHNELGDVTSMIFSMNAHHVKIVGEGCIDLNGEQYFEGYGRRIPERMKDTITPEQIEECTVAHGERLNQPMFFYQVKDFVLEGVTIINAPTWGTTFVECAQIVVDGVKIRHSLIIPNCDGIHFCSSRDIIVKNCDIVSGDDCLAFTAITNWDVPTENVLVENCYLKTCSKAISIGYMHSHVRNVVISNVKIEDSNRGIVIMQNPYTGSVRDVIIDNLEISTRVYAGDWWGNGEPICLMAVPHQLGYRGTFSTSDEDLGVRNIIISNVKCDAENKLAIVGTGRNVKNVVLDRVTFHRRPSKNLALKGNVIDFSPSSEHFQLDGLEEYDCIVRDVDGLAIHSPSLKVSVE